MEQTRTDRNWLVSKTDASEAAIESTNTVFTVSNGYLALKGNLLENRRGAYPTTILAGVFDQADMVAFLRPAKEERRYLDPDYFDDAGPSPSVANLPNPLFVKVFVEGIELTFPRGIISDFRQDYDLRTGVYSYQYDHHGRDGKRTHVEMARFADMRNVHCALMRCSLTPLNYSGRITIQSGIEGAIRSNLKKDKQFEVVEAGGDDGNRCFMQARTIARGIEIRIAVANVLPSAGYTMVEDEAVYNVFEIDAREGQTIVLDKHMVISSSEDGRHSVECDLRGELQRSVALGFDRACGEQRESWREIWEKVDVEIEGDDRAQLYLRFCLFHLMSAAPRHTDKLSVPCKLLTGEHYQGTTFYDTDLYIEPVYLLSFPAFAQTSLNYRYVGLAPAREIARGLGCRGAKFAWQAGPHGEEALGRWWRFTHTNIHINGDVAYSLMQYWYATGDAPFMTQRGIDILVEASRFYASRATYDVAHGRYDLDDVAGPDEGHCESKNNFYTNLLAKKTLAWAAEMLDFIHREWPMDYEAVVKRLSIEDSEPETWRAVAQGLTFYYDPETKLYEQCEGFYELAPIPPDLLADRKAWFVTVFPYQAMNQPDVVMAMALFPNDFPDDVKRANWEFYRDKSMNFSSMSFAVNSMMAKDVGDIEYAYRQFLICAGEDLDEELTGRRDTAEGIHGTASGGAWMAAVFGFGGVRLTDRGLSINPRLPRHWKSLKFKLLVRGALLSFEVDHGRTRVSVSGDGAVDLAAEVAGEKLTLCAGHSYEFPTAGLSARASRPGQRPATT